MSETSITYLVLSLLACIASFFFGYFFCKSRGTGLAGNTDICNKLTNSIEGSSERVEGVENKLGGILEAGNNIEEILRKYSTTTTESKNLE